MYFFLAMGGLATLGYLLFKNSAEEIIRSSEQQVAHACELVDIKFSSFLQDVQRDIIYLANSPHLQDYLFSERQKGEGVRKKLLAEEYLALINSKPDYAQIRLIGVENNGREIIRAERLNGQTFLVQGDKLQEKGTRNYFFETILLPKDSIYFSPIDLNKEYGKITNPPIPTLRTAIPIYEGAHLLGIVVINVDLRRFFKELDVLAGPNFNLKILNQTGHFLIHPDTQQVFTFEYGRPPRFENDFGVSIDFLKKLFSGQNKTILNREGNLYAFREFNYPREGSKLYIGIGADEKNILQSFYDWRKKSLTITFGLAFFIFFLAFIYMSRQVKELRDITKTMTSFPKNLTPAKLPISRKDEIGQLAKSFEEMSAIISRNLSDLKKAKKEVEQAIQEKDAFLENMSHEIRNPIHSIIGMTHLLENNNPARHQKAFIESLKFNSKNLLSLVNDILDFKKLYTGEIQLKKEWLSLPSLIQEIIKSHKFNAVAKKVNLITEIDLALNQYLVFLDPVRLTQIVNNLVMNAIKFTNELGEVCLTITVSEKKEDRFVVRFSVKDNGVGIEKDMVDKIVERYYTRAETQVQNFPEGAGLGLPIVVQLLKLYSSTLRIESAPGEGSDFYFDLTTDIKALANSTDVSNDFTFNNLLKKGHLLAIDDDEQVLFLYEHIFKKWVGNIVLVSNTEELKEIDDSLFDIVISDINFNNKKLNNFGETLQRVLVKKGLLYVVSGTERTALKVSAMPAVKDFFQKPISPGALLDKITFDYAVNKFGHPDTSNILNDYDHDQVKFKKALNLLVVDWEKMFQQIESVAANNDRKKYTAICHKLITAVRRLNLTIFEKMLDSPLSGDAAILNRLAIEDVKEAMSFYIWSLKREL